MQRKLLFGLVALALVLPLSVALGGTTGKIMGLVNDDKGAPLPGANVVIEGTKRGAVTGADGTYFIINVDLGTYSLSASLIGYTKVTKRDVRISVDYTTTVDFRLKEEAVAAAEVVVTAERPPVEADKTSSKYLVSAEDIQQTPIIKTTGELISLQPGVDMGGTFSVRGSDAGFGTAPVVAGTNNYRANDVYVTIDGIRVANKDGHSAILFTGVNKSAVQQISVETGVTSAEYGDAQAGTINIVTQEGAQKFHGWMEFQYEPPGQKHWGSNVYDSPIHQGHMRWNDPEWLKETDPVTGRLIHQREDYTGVSGYRAEGSVSGPIGSKASFLASLKHEARAETFPSATSHGFYNDRGQYINAPDNIQGAASVTFKPSASVKVKAGLVLQRYTAFNDEVNEPNYGVNEGFIRGMRNNGRNLFLPKSWASSGKYRQREELEYVTFTHMLSPKTFYEVRVARSKTVQDTINAPPWTDEPRADKERWFTIDRQVAMWIQSERARWSLKADLSSQITKGNFVKAGLEVMRHNAYYTFWASRSKADNWFTFYSGGDRPYEMGSPARPIRGAIYAQDKMEFEGLIVNVGARLDFNIHTHKEVLQSGYVWAPMWRRFTDRHYAYESGTVNGVTIPEGFVGTPPSQWRVSPRLGISHPVTDRMVMHFSLGRFIQWVDIYDIYSKSYRNYGTIGPDGRPDWGEDVNKNGKMDPTEYLNNMQPHNSGYVGDPMVHPEETLTFEVGFDWNFVSDYTASLTTFYRNETQQVGYGGNTWSGPKGTGNYVRGQSNAATAYAKGVEIAIGKRLSHYFSFRVAWTSQWTADGFMGMTQWGQYSFPDSNFIASGKFWYNFKSNPDGSYTAIPLTAKEVQEFGRQANSSIQAAADAWRDNPYYYFGKNPDLGDQGIYNQLWSIGGAVYGPMTYGVEKVRGIQGQANVQLILNTPSDVRFGPRWMGWLASDLNANLLWKMRTGARFAWSLPAGGQRIGRGPVDSVTDLSVEKAFNAKGRVRPSLFVEVRNLFNEQERTTAGADYQRWGLQMARPDNAVYLTYGDIGEQNYFNRPRLVNLGVRVNF